MKKIARLLEIERRFGKEFVLPYRICTTEQEIRNAADFFASDGKTWGMRTDTPDEGEQSYLSPFILHGTDEEALSIFRAHGHKLIYIVSENIPAVLLHGVAEYVSGEDVFFEWNERESTISQRAMYNHPENLRHIVVGSGGFTPVRESMVRTVKPEDVRSRRFDVVRELMLIQSLRARKEITFSVRLSDRRLVLW